MPLILRTTKGSPLTYSELDGNFQFLTGSIDSVTVNKVNSQLYQSDPGSLGVANTGNFGFAAGSVNMTAGAATSSTFPSLAGKTLGTNAWISTSMLSGFSSGDGVIVNSISPSGEISFSGLRAGNPGSGIFMFTCMFLV